MQLVQRSCREKFHVRKTVLFPPFIHRCSLGEDALKSKIYLSCLLASAVVPPVALAQTTSAGEVTDIGSVDANATGTSTSKDNGLSATGVTRKELGGGLMVDENVSKSKSSVTRDFIQKQQPSADVFQLLKLSPGANASASDAYGLNQGLISVRGLDGTQLGFNFEGMPLSVASNWSVFPGQWIDTENTDVVTLNQGSADLASPNVNATGGVVDLFLHTPTKEPGGLFDVMYGSNNAKRIFLRLETGDVRDTGIRSFISYSHIEADHFRGVGHDEKDIASVGILKDWGGGSSTKLAMTYTNEQRDTYKNPTLAQWNAGGANGKAANYDSTYTTNDTSYYKLLKNPWENILLSAPTILKLNDKAKISITPYYYYGYGASGSATVLNESSVGYGNTVNAVDLNGNGTTTDTSVLVYNPILENNTRAGVTTKINYQLENHALVAGIWYQYSRDELYRPYSTTNADGTASSVSGETHLITTADGRVVNGWYQDTRDNFYAAFFGDTISMLDDKLALDIGVKRLWMDRVGINNVPSTVSQTEANRSATLPTVALRYKFDEVNSVYATAAKGYRMLPAGSLYPRYSASTGAVTTAANANQQSETSTSVELGYRYQSNVFSVSTSVFNYDFKNRQISASVCDPGCVSAPINGGAQNARGIDFEAGLRPYKNFRPYVSFEYLKTKIESNIAVAGDYLPTYGKQAVRSPKFQAALATDYDDSVYFGNLAFKYVGSQYATFMNDEKIPGYVTADATMGFRWGDMGLLKKPEIRLNILNIFNKQYLSGVYSATTNAKATTGVNGTTVAASTPTYLVANGITAMITFATSF
jgi:iron complex outermembrane recepter protein